MASDQVMRSLTIFYATAVLMAFMQIVAVESDPQVPCLFIFGDSESDNGNNNYAATLARVNYSPYGIDFPPGYNPTGRFNNGPTTVDYIAKLLGFDDFITPFATASRDVILKGVNYASGSSGIRDDTSLILGLVLNMNKQLRNHEVTIHKLIANFFNSSEAAQEYLNKCIFYVRTGTEDYIYNYYLPPSLTSLTFTPEQYAEDLIDKFQRQLETLYDLGARKVVLTGIGPIGCRPYSITRFGTNGSSCVDRFNRESQLFNDKLVGLVDRFNSNFSNAKFIYVNTVGIVGAPNFPGFTVKNVPCCRVSKLTGLCLPLLTPCKNRSTYVYWDAYHPTTAVNKLIADRSNNALFPNDSYPIDIRRLAQLQL